MHRLLSQKQRRLAFWIGLNLVIFITCYLNYRLQLKHRYLYKTLNIGLCFSRAAAMMINFNLLLVWLPMCKYSLTRLACLGSSSLRRQRKLEQDLRLTVKNADVELESIKSIKHKLFRSIQDTLTQIKLCQCRSKIRFIESFLMAVDHCKSLHTICATTITLASVVHTVAHLMNVINFSKNFDALLSNLNMADFKGQNPLQLLISVPGLTGILMIIILLLMSLSSMNCFRSSSFDLFQVFHRLSVLFVILLFLHPSSHVLKEQSNVDRHHPEICYDIMVSAQNQSALSPPNSQSRLYRNLMQHKTIQSREHVIVEPLPTTLGVSSMTNKLDHQHVSQQKRANMTARILIDDIRRAEPTEPDTVSTKAINSTVSDLTNQSQVNFKDGLKADYPTTLMESVSGKPKPVRKSASIAYYDLDDAKNNNTPAGKPLDRKPGDGNKSMTVIGSASIDRATGNNVNCQDDRPLFVNQSSICWYVLVVGLSCYLIDLLLRRLRTSRSSIQPLTVRSDVEGNILELEFSNNHKRFALWQPGQFVYLNCPQIATFEWHPFTISSMDNSRGIFTLHIKTGGDWTRKLREQLCHSETASSNREHSPSSYPVRKKHIDQIGSTYKSQRLSGLESNSVCLSISNGHYLGLVPSLASYGKSGKLAIECTKIVRTQYSDEHNLDSSCEQGREAHSNHQYELGSFAELDQDHDKQKLPLDLFIDGPFHSPFERLIEQQVSVCIANGVGWTAFSSIFQCITNNLDKVNTDSKSNLWWTKWESFAIENKKGPLQVHSLEASGSNVNKNKNNRDSHVQTTGRPTETDQSRRDKLRAFSESNLHILVVVTNLDQLRPMYDLASNYFDFIRRECHVRPSDSLNPIREITAFLTKADREDFHIKSFCSEHNLELPESDTPIRVNDVFTIQLGRPNLERYLAEFRTRFSDKKKISVYCCGSYQVKKDVKKHCHNLNKSRQTYSDRLVPYFTYHEEDF